MYLSYEHFIPIAEKLIQKVPIKVNKLTNGIDKGEYRASIDLSKIDFKEQDEYLKNIFGVKVSRFNNLSGKTKEEAERRLIRDIASDLYANDRRTTNQYFSDIYKYYEQKKAEKDIHLIGKVGYSAVDYFNVLDGKYNAENYKNKNNNYHSNLSNRIDTIDTFKEFYFLCKQQAKEEWLKNNQRYTDFKQRHEKDYFKVETFKFDIENLPHIAEFEAKLEGKPILQKTELPTIQNIENKGFVKIGYRPNFLKSPIIYGRERNIILANGEKHKALFAIVELDEILASHNELNFSSTENYPTTQEGRNINDRNYAGDVNAQAKVISVSQNFEPEIIISTSATASGTPIISIDGVVVSGNNRTMSLKLAKIQNKAQYENYLQTLHLELNYQGYGFAFESIGAALKLKGRIPLPNSSFNNSLNVRFENPILVRIDYDFQSYTTDEMAKYNKSTKKSERPVDVSIKMSQQLSENSNCLDSLLSLISEQEIVSDLYNNPTAVKRFKTILIDCNLITENDVSSLFIGNTLTENGKTFYNTLLLSLVLDPKVLEISQNAGIKSIISNVVNSIIDLNKNKTFSTGSIITDLNNAILLQNKMISSNQNNIAEFIKEGELFGNNENLTKKASIINYWLNQKANDFKKLLKIYNSAILDSLLPNMFGDSKSPNELFKEVFEKELDKQMINLLNLVFPNPETTSIVKDEKINANFDEKAEIESQLQGLKIAYKYNPDQEIADLIAALEITLKYT